MDAFDDDRNKLAERIWSKKKVVAEFDLASQRGSRHHSPDTLTKNMEYHTENIAMEKTAKFNTMASSLMICCKAIKLKGLLTKI